MQGKLVSGRVEQTSGGAGILLGQFLKKSLRKRAMEELS
jgi:hypothetical protein